MRKLAGQSGLLLLALTLVSAPAARAAEPDAAEALDAMVAGKPALERGIPVQIDVVGYDLQANPKAAQQLKAVSAAGGGAYSTAGVKDIGRVMQGLVKGKPPAAAPAAAPAPAPAPAGRVQYGDRLIRHDAVK